MNCSFISNHSLEARFANVYTGMKTLDSLARIVGSAEMIIPYSLQPRDKEAAFQALRSETGTLGSAITLRQVPRLHIGERLKGSYAYFAAATVRISRRPLVWSRNVLTGILSARLGVPTIIEHHTPFNDRHIRAFKKLDFNMAPVGILAISEAHRSILHAQGIPLKNLIMARLASEPVWPLPSRTQPREMGLPEGPIVMYAGSFYPGRGIDLLIDVAAQMPSVQFVLIGYSPEVVHARGKDFEQDKPANLHIFSKVPYSQVPSYLSCSNILVAPYTESAETIDGVLHSSYFSPAKIFDYLAIRKPIVATAVGAINEILQDRKNALLVEPNVGSICDAIQTLLADSRLSKVLSDNAYRSSLMHTWETRVSKVLDSFSHISPSFIGGVGLRGED